MRCASVFMPSADVLRPYSRSSSPCLTLLLSSDLRSPAFNDTDVTPLNGVSKSAINPLFAPLSSKSLSVDLTGEVRAPDLRAAHSAH